MRVVPIAYTMFDFDAAEQSGYRSWYSGALWDRGERPRDIDELAEMAGRNCYQAWERKNPATSTNEGYLANIIDHGHFSVLEHGSVTFYVDGVSRSLSHELIRHRHLSFSELSQRFVNVEETEFITPPGLLDLLVSENPSITWRESNANFRRDEAAKEIVKTYASIFSRVAGHLYDKGYAGSKLRKKAREAARAVMPNCTETKFVVTGNLRAWRDVLGKRWHEAADEEIKQFSGEVLKHLRELAPNSVRDIPDTPYEGAL